MTRDATAARLRPFGTSVFAEMTALALEHGAINLSQGYPDFDGPEDIVEAAARAMREGENQYARSRGHLALVRAIAASRERLYGLRLEPEREVGVFSGATEGIAASLLGLLDPGDEVILFEPFYDSYPVCATLAGARVRALTLRFPDFTLDPAALEALVTSRTKVLVLNTPHNPTGKVFTRDELEIVADLCRRHDLICLADEVYEHLVYDGAVHVPIATLPGMRERTLTLGSTGKTFSFTGWKIGWATGPAALCDAAQAAHQFLTFATATPLQVAMAQALARVPGPYTAQLAEDYRRRRDTLVAALVSCGLEVAVPRGTYFIMARFSGLFDGDDRAFARWLTERAGVTPIPPSAFYSADPDEGTSLCRFAFCKKEATLAEASSRLRALQPM